MNDQCDTGVGLDHRNPDDRTESMVRCGKKNKAPREDRKTVKVAQRNVVDQICHQRLVDDHQD